MRRLGQPRSLGSPLFYPGDWSQTGAIVSDSMRTLTQGDYGSDLNCPVVHQISPRIQHGLTTNVATKAAEFDKALFLEEVQRYVCICNKLLKDYESRCIRLNSWEAIGEKFGLDTPGEAKRRLRIAQSKLDVHESTLHTSLSFLKIF